MHKAKCDDSKECGCFKRPLPAQETLADLEFQRSIWIAAKDGDVEKVQRLVNKGVDVNLQDSYGYTALHYAARAGNVQIVRELIAKGANVCLVTKSGATALHRCAYVGSEDVIRLLLNKDKSCAYLRDDDGDTFLHKAAKGGHKGLAEKLSTDFPELCDMRNNRNKVWSEDEPL